MNKKEAYIKLAAAVLRQAMDDYIDAIRHHNDAEQKALEKFFLSGYGQLLSMNHGEFLIEQAKAEAEKKRKKWQRKYKAEM